jgi:hypothetical protein
VHAPIQKKGRAYLEDVVCALSEGKAHLYSDMYGIKSISDPRAFRRKGAQHSEDDQYCALIKRKEHRARVRRNIRFEANISENEANF